MVELLRIEFWGSKATQDRITKGRITEGRMYIVHFPHVNIQGYVGTLCKT